MLDYIFRELAVSYLARNDLAHVEPSDMTDTDVGPVEPQHLGKPAMPATRVVSHGFTRGQMVGRIVPRTADYGGVSMLASPVSALQDDLRHKLGETTTMGALALNAAAQTETAPQSQARIAGQRAAEARLKGYDGNSCGECGNFTLVRNGTCMKCDTCGLTTGCS